MTVLQFDDKVNTLEEKFQAIDAETLSNLRLNQSEYVKNQFNDQSNSYGTFPMPQETFATMSPEAISPKTTISRDNG